MASRTCLGTAGRQLALDEKRGEKDHVGGEVRRVSVPQDQAAEPEIVFGEELFRSAVRVPSVARPIGEAWRKKLCPPHTA
eukprot:CAMPEP_0117560218 /NCGR_PEP_ID=MMETSP0784-20121206/53762_1 /TAXON_ID=39447 /ORGANISM="" /LENGTH=79 /DNA_ID=CAMNT_0005357619 /DNA_START=639 /DNA_END=878 /DNA_ORIENTATION=+